jgi:hypothetical protein
MGTANNNPPPGDIDARLQFLLSSTESLHSSLQELHANLDKSITPVLERIDALTATSERHEREIKRFTRMMIPALTAYLSGDQGEPQ